MQVIDLGASLREVWQEISPSTFMVTLLRTTGENHWEVRSRTRFYVEGENNLVVQDMGPRIGVDVEKAPQGDSADSGSNPLGSTTHHFIVHPLGGLTCYFLVAQDETCKLPPNDAKHRFGDLLDYP